MAAWLAPVLGLLGTGLASGLNYWSQQRTNKQNIAQANLQYYRQKADIQAQNQYNSPAAQVIRLRNAGINPSLYYGGSGAAVAGEQSQIASYDRPDLTAPSLDAKSVYGSVVDLANMETKKSEANANIEYLRKKSAKLGVEIAFDIQNNPTLLEQAKANLAVTKANEDYTRSRIDQIYSRTPQTEQDLKLAAQAYKINENELEMALARFPQEMLLMDAQTALAWAQEHKNRSDVQIAFATLAETIRHNKESELLIWSSNNIKRDSVENAYEIGKGNQELARELNSKRFQQSIVQALLCAGLEIVNRNLSFGSEIF